MKAIVILALLVVGCGRSSGSDAIAPDDGRHAGSGDDASASSSDTVVEVACDGGGLVEAAFPGKTEQELERVHVASHTTSDAGFVPGYAWAQSGGYIRDGFVAVPCAQTDDFVRVTLPAR